LSPKALQIVMRLLVTTLIVGVTIFALTHLAEFQPSRIQAFLTDNPWAPLAFVIAHIAVSLVFVPRTVMSVAAGLVFGLWGGIWWSTVGAMAGALTGFVLARYVLGDFFPFDRQRWLAALKQRLERGGWRAVAFVRLVPILPHTPVNYAFGLTDISVSAYLVGSFVGLLPTTVLWVDVGAAGGQIMDGSVNWVEPTLVGLGALAASLLLPKLRLLR
jgi:uncharacterized membrane protein YdjX (TVP38/TMEM64 family)